MANKVPFQKPYTSSRDLVKLLQSRGLTVNDTARAERYLDFIGYYRLSAYMYPLLQMPKELHRYKTGSTFKQVMTLYRFDKKLRLLIFNEIEKIEVAVRSAIVNTGSELTGSPFWMTDRTNFIAPTKFQHTMELIDAELRRSREDFLVHFRQTYTDAYPNTIRPMMPNRMDGVWLTLPTDPLRIYFDLCIIKYFLNIISPQNDMRDKLIRLLKDFPSIDTAAMGFPKGWQQEPLWQ